MVCHVHRKIIDTAVRRIARLEVTSTSGGDKDLRKFGQKYLEMTLRHLV